MERVITETLGEKFPDGSLFEYFYNPDKGQASLVALAAGGRFMVNTELKHDGHIYQAQPADSLIKGGVVTFPTNLGKSLSTKDLFGLVDGFLESNFLFPSALIRRIASYYVMYTWLFDCFDTAVYLGILGFHGSGKTELARRMGLLTYRTINTFGAGTMTSILRVANRYKGTLVFDPFTFGPEIDDSLVKILNTGAIKANRVWINEEEIAESGAEIVEVRDFDVFGPKIMVFDLVVPEEVKTRSISIGLEPDVSMNDLSAQGIPYAVTMRMQRQARIIRNNLLTWRLNNWKPAIEPDKTDLDTVSSSSKAAFESQILAILGDSVQLREQIMADFTASSYFGLVTS